MIIYNKTWLANQRLQGEVEAEVKSKNVTADEFKAIVLKYPVGFYTPNIFIRVALFILTCIVVCFGEGLISLVLSSSGMVETYGWLIFCGLLTYAGLELMVRSNNYYRSGVDDALMLISGCQVTGGLAMMLMKGNDSDYALTLSFIILVVSVFLMLRCADMFMSAVMCLSFFAFVFFFWIKVIPAGLATAPFIMMLVAGGTYWLMRNHQGKKEHINYHNCLVVGQFVSLLALYTAGNYYIIQTLSTEMAHKTGPVPFGAIFWIWTILLPFIYIGFGIKKKDQVLLRTGLLLIAAAAATFRNYYHVLPVDVSLTIIGALILGIVYGVTKYLKTPKRGFTIAEPDDINLLDRLKVESLIAAETFAHAPVAPASAPDNSSFGGGSFGGGGSSANF